MIDIPAIISDAVFRAVLLAVVIVAVVAFGAVITWWRADE